MSATTEAAPPLSRADWTHDRDPLAHPVPTGREEAWRFAPLGRFAELFGLPEPATGVAALAAEVTPAPGVRVEWIPAHSDRVGRAFVPEDRAAAVALASTPEVLAVSVAPGAQLDAPVRVRLRGTEGLRRTHGHTLVEIGAGARAVVLVEYTGAARYAGSLELLAGDGCDVTLVSVQDWDAGSVHLGAQALRLGTGARCRHVVVTLGTATVRLAPSVSYAGPGGDADLRGLFLAGAGAYLEHRIFVDHEAPDCRSRVTYRGALAGAGARTVWVGDVLIGPDASGTDTYELNRNLVLGRGARADSVPNLEIRTGEVARAGHASATGRFDDETLFYLMSRGIPAHEARRLVVRGFFTGLIDDVDLADLTARIDAGVEELLAAAADEESG